MKVNDEVIWQPDRKMIATVVDVAEDHIMLDLKVKLYHGEFNAGRLATIGKKGFEVPLSNSDKNIIKGGGFTLWELEEGEIPNGME